MSKTILITGGCGFIGHHFVEHVYINTDWNIIIIDKLSYASNGFERLRDTGCLNDDRVKVFTNDLINPIPEGIQKEIGKNVKYIVHYFLYVNKYTSNIYAEKRSRARHNN